MDSGRADLLATLFYLLSLLAYETFTRTNRGRSLLSSLALFCVALLAKEAVICLPLVVIVLGAYTARERRGEMTSLVLRPAAAFFVVLMLYVAARTSMLGTLVGGYGGVTIWTFRIRLSSVNSYGSCCACCSRQSL